MKRMTHKDFKNYDTSKQDIIVAIIFIVVSMGLMLFWSNKADEFAFRELSKPTNYEEEVN